MAAADGELVGPVGEGLCSAVGKRVGARGAEARGVLVEGRRRDGHRHSAGDEAGHRVDQLRRSVAHGDVLGLDPEHLAGQPALDLSPGGVLA